MLISDLEKKYIKYKSKYHYLKNIIYNQKGGTLRNVITSLKPRRLKHNFGEDNVNLFDPIDENTIKVPNNEFVRLLGVGGFTLINYNNIIAYVKNSSFKN
uniref:Uncharacterized protein n=1 Tax=viral metagenome TaxID=1070528 RepID=A0A6C0J5V9_9ZZZZ